MHSTRHPVKSAAARKLRKIAKRRAWRARKRERKLDALARRPDNRDISPGLLQQQQQQQLAGPCHGQIEMVNGEEKTLSATGAGAKDVAHGVLRDTSSASDAEGAANAGADARATGRGAVAAAAEAVEASAPCHGQIEMVKGEEKTLSATGAGVKDVTHGVLGDTSSASDAEGAANAGADARATGRGTVAAAAEAVEASAHEKVHDVTVEVAKNKTGGAAVAAEAAAAADDQANKDTINHGAEAKLARRRLSFVLPPARQHTIPAANAAIGTRIPSPASTSEQKKFLVTHPLQLIQGRAVLYDPMEYGLWAVMSQLQGWALALGTAPILTGGNQREAEAFSAACGFSAAWGPTVLEIVTTSVYGQPPLSRGSDVLPLDRLLYAIGTYWETDICPYDAAERVFRLLLKVGGAATTGATVSSRGIRKVCA